MMKKIVDFCYEKVYVGCRFNFKPYARKVRKKATQYSLKATEVLMVADGHVYQDTIDPNCFKSHRHS